MESTAMADEMLVNFRDHSLLVWTLLWKKSAKYGAKLLAYQIKGTTTDTVHAFTVGKIRMDTPL